MACCFFFACGPPTAAINHGAFFLTCTYFTSSMVKHCAWNACFEKPASSATWSIKICAGFHAPNCAFASDSQIGANWFSALGFAGCLLTNDASDCDGRLRFAIEKLYTGPRLRSHNQRWAANWKPRLRSDVRTPRALRSTK